MVYQAGNRQAKSTKIIGAYYSTRDYQDVLNGDMFLHEVSQATREHVMFTLRSEALKIVKSGNIGLPEWAGLLREELQSAINNILENSD